MTDKQKEAIERLKRIDIRFFLSGMNEQSNYIVDEADKVNNAIETVLNLIQTQQEEIDSLKDFKEIAESKVTDLNPIGLARTNQLLSRQCHKLQEESEKKEEWINKLETKLMYALTPTKHELAKRTQEEFKEIIRDNIDEDTYTIKRKLKEEWNIL